MTPHHPGNTGGNKREKKKTRKKEISSAEKRYNAIGVMSSPSLPVQSPVHATKCPANLVITSWLGSTGQQPWSAVSDVYAALSQICNQRQMGMPVCMRHAVAFIYMSNPPPKKNMCLVEYRYWHRDA